VRNRKLASAIRGRTRAVLALGNGSHNASEAEAEAEAEAALSSHSREGDAGGLLPFMSRFLLDCQLLLADQSLTVSSLSDTATIPPSTFHLFSTEIAQFLWDLCDPKRFQLPISFSSSSTSSSGDRVETSRSYFQSAIPIVFASWKDAAGATALATHRLLQSSVQQCGMISEATLASTRTRVGADQYVQRIRSVVAVCDKVGMPAKVGVAAPERCCSGSYSPLPAALMEMHCRILRLEAHQVIHVL
jgi:hypothetical protein